MNILFVFQVEIVLNFFPGDHSTADKYKRFVQKLTKVIFLLIMMRIIVIMLTLFVLMIIMINKVMRMILKMRMMTDGNWKFAKGTCNAMWWHSAPHSR